MLALRRRLLARARDRDRRCRAQGPSVRISAETAAALDELAGARGMATRTEVVAELTRAALNGRWAGSRGVSR